MTRKELIQSLLDTKFFINNKYFKKYITLIMSNKDNVKIKFETEQHHILPKSYFKILGIKDKKIINAKSNLVHLNYQNHILAHYYLYFCSKNKEFKQSNLICFINMTQEKSIHLDEDFLFKKLQSYNELRKIWKLCLSLKNKGKTNKKISEWLKEHHFDCSGENNSRARSVYVYNDATFELIKTYGAQCIAGKEIGVVNLKEKLNKSKYHLIFYNDMIITKNYPLNLDDVKSAKQLLKDAQDLKRTHKRFKYNFICSYCGKEYSLYLNDLKYKSYLHKVVENRSCCGECSRNGNFMRNKLKSKTHKENISKSRIGQKWVHNDVEELQVNTNILQEYLNKGYVMGQFPKVTIIKDNRKISISQTHLDKYLSEGWVMYEKGTNNK